MPLDPDTAELAIRTAIADAYERSAKIVEASKLVSAIDSIALADQIRKAALARGLSVQEWWIAASKESISTDESLERLRSMLAKVDDPCAFAAHLVATLVEIAPLLPLDEARKETLLFALGLVQNDLLPLIKQP